MGSRRSGPQHNDGPSLRLTIVKIYAAGRPIERAQRTVRTIHGDSVRIARPIARNALGVRRPRAAGLRDGMLKISFCRGSVKSTTRRMAWLLGHCNANDWQVDGPLGTAGYGLRGRCEVERDGAGFPWGLFAGNPSNMIKEICRPDCDSSWGPQQQPSDCPAEPSNDQNGAVAGRPATAPQRRISCVAEREVLREQVEASAVRKQKFGEGVSFDPGRSRHRPVFRRR